MSKHKDAASLENCKVIPVQFLLEALKYDKWSGVFKWKTRPLHHFESEWRMNNFNSRWAGKVAGQKSKWNIRIEITYEGRTRILFAHHLAWLLSDQKFLPGLMIDHRNGNGHDNRVINLRLVDRKQNNRNRRLSPQNKTGCAGVFKHADGGGWVAMIRADGKMTYLGYFRVLHDAVACRKAAEAKYYGEYTREATMENYPVWPRCPSCSSFMNIQF